MKKIKLFAVIAMLIAFTIMGGGDAILTKIFLATTMKLHPAKLKRNLIQIIR